MPPDLEKRPRTPSPPRDPRIRPARPRKTPPWAKFKKKTDAVEVIDLSSDDYVFESAEQAEEQEDMTEGQRLLKYFKGMYEDMMGEESSSDLS